MRGAVSFDCDCALVSVSQPKIEARSDGHKGASRQEDSVVPRFLA